MPHTTPLTGKVLGRRYALGEILGEGGFGTVYRAVDRRLKREVAVKVIKPWWAEDPDWLSRFEREAEVVARLNHPGVVQIYDAGRDSRGLYYVSELVEGESLRDRLAREGGLSETDAVAITRQLCEALGSAHAAGVIHRDIKPANILLTRDGRVKLADFGIARITRGDTRSTSAGTMIGTPLYWSPEQAAGRATTPASDVYSVGVVLFEALAGQPPFDGEGHVDLALKHLHDAPPELPDSVSPHLKGVVAQALAKVPADRFEDAAALGRALQMEAPAPRSSAARTAEFDLDPATVATTCEIPSRQRRRRVAVGIAALSLALAAIAVALLLPSSDNAGGNGATASDRHGSPAQAAAGTPAAATRVRVPRVVGASKAVARDRLKRHGFKVSITRNRSTVAEGHVVTQAPSGRTVAAKGDTVYLVVSAGPPPPTVPNVRGDSSTTAQAKVRAVGLVPAVNAGSYPGHSPGTVVKQSPAGGSHRPRGTAVTLTVAARPTWHQVLSLSGKGDKSTPRFRIRGERWRVHYTVDMSHCDFGICFGLHMLLNTGEWDLDVDRGGSDTSDVPVEPGIYSIDLTAGKNVRSWSVQIEDYY